MELNDQVKALLGKLGMAMNKAFIEDPRVKSITKQIKDNGYDIYLFVEANFVLDKREDEEEGRFILRSPEDQIDYEEEMQFNRYDEAFLADLKIKIDET